MDWKPYYDAELREPKARAKITQWLQTADEMANSLETCDSQTILSFPHTAIDYSGSLQAQVVSWLYGRGFKRVIALGVMHGALIPTYQVAANLSAPRAEREAAFARICGAFLPPVSEVNTPFGSLDVYPVGGHMGPLVRLDRKELLKNEFSLDTFHAIVRLAADVYKIDPLPVIPLYIGMMRNPLTGSFEAAAELAQWLQDGWDEDTAIVTTGDVVHYGAVYGSEDEDVALEILESRFTQRLETVFERAFRETKLEQAFQIAWVELKSDQREILPVIASLLGTGSVAEIKAFSLSDYSSIFDTLPPCLVASAMIAYKRRHVD